MFTDLASMRDQNASQMSLEDKPKTLIPARISRMLIILLPVLDEIGDFSAQTVGGHRIPAKNVKTVAKELRERVFLHAEFVKEMR